MDMNPIDARHIATTTARDPLPGPLSSVAISPRTREETLSCMGLPTVHGLLSVTLGPHRGGLFRRVAGRRAVLALEPAGERIAAVRIVINPDKLHGVPDGGNHLIASEQEAPVTGPVREGSRPWD